MAAGFPCLIHDGFSSRLTDRPTDRLALAAFQNAYRAARCPASAAPGQRISQPGQAQTNGRQLTASSRQPTADSLLPLTAPTRCYPSRRDIVASPGDGAVTRLRENTRTTWSFPLSHQSGPGTPWVTAQEGEGFPSPILRQPSTMLGS